MEIRRNQNGAYTVVQVQKGQPGMNQQEVVIRRR
ncbi:Uncharacterised protein [Mycobacteroides abscessus subsp. bolletii]|nr:Uncharacterised protein [Mycobacteroides abscessus subsp. bolletii]